MLISGLALIIFSSSYSSWLDFSIFTQVKVKKILERQTLTMGAQGGVVIFVFYLQSQMKYNNHKCITLFCELEKIRMKSCPS